MRWRRFVLVAVFTAALPVAVAALPAIGTKLSVLIDGRGFANARLTVANRSGRAICIPVNATRVFLTTADGSILGPVTAERHGRPGESDMATVASDGLPHEFVLPLNEDQVVRSANPAERPVEASYVFNAYDCGELSTDRLHAKPRIQRTLSTVPGYSN